MRATDWSPAGGYRLRVNRTQALVVGFFALAWLALLLILRLAPAVYESVLRLPNGDVGLDPVVFLTALTAFLLMIGIGVLQRWRWTFWLVLVAFLSGILRIPVSALQLAGTIPSDAPSWYVVLQGGLGVAQFGIGLAMIAGFRRAGTWGRF